MVCYLLDEVFKSEYRSKLTLRQWTHCASGGFIPPPALDAEKCRVAAD